MELSECQLETYTSFDVSLNAKGFAQWEVKVKYPTVQESEKHLVESIKALRKVLEESGLKEAGQ